MWALANARGNMSELAAASAMHFDPATGNPITAAAWARGLNSSTTVEAANAQGRAIIVYQMKRVEHDNNATGQVLMSGKYLPSAPQPASPAAAAVAEGAVSAARAQSGATSNTPIIVGGAIAVVGGACALWWFRFGGRKLWRK